MIQIWPNLDILTLLVNEIPLVSFSTPLEGNCYVKLKGNICQKLFLYIEKYKGNFLRAPEFFSCKIIPTYHRVTHLLVNSKKFALGVSTNCCNRHSKSSWHFMRGVAYLSTFKHSRHQKSNYIQSWLLLGLTWDTLCKIWNPTFLSY